MFSTHASLGIPRIIIIFNDTCKINAWNAKHKVFHCFASPIFGRVVNYTADLGGIIEKNSLGQITKAQSIALKWFVAINQTEVKAGRSVPDMGTGEVADATGLAWETEFINLMDNIMRHIPDGTKLYFATGRRLAKLLKRFSTYNSLVPIIKRRICEKMNGISLMLLCNKCE